MKPQVFEVYVCPECRQQLHPEGDEYSVTCYDHHELVDGVAVEVTVDPAEILRQLEPGSLIARVYSTGRFDCWVQLWRPHAAGDPPDPPQFPEPKSGRPGRVAGYVFVGSAYASTRWGAHRKRDRMIRRYAAGLDPERDPRPVEVTTA